MIHWGPFLLEPERTWNKTPWLLQSSFSFSSPFYLFYEAAGTVGTVQAHSSSAAHGNVLFAGRYSCNLYLADYIEEQTSIPVEMNTVFLK